jgi:hypothetical protein
MPDGRETGAAGSPPTDAELAAFDWLSKHGVDVSGGRAIIGRLVTEVRRLRATVAAETDRCADVAARFAGEAAARAGALPAGVGARRHMEAVAAAEGVAAAIRAGVTP